MSPTLGAVMTILSQCTTSSTLCMLWCILLSAKDKNNILMFSLLSTTSLASTTMILSSKLEWAHGWPTKPSLLMAIFFNGLSFLELNKEMNFQTIMESIGTQGSTEDHRRQPIFLGLGKFIITLVILISWDKLTSFIESSLKMVSRDSILDTPSMQLYAFTTWPKNLDMGRMKPRNGLIW